MPSAVFALREILILFPINYERSTLLFSEPEMRLLQPLKSTVKRGNFQFRTEDRLCNSSDRKVSLRSVCTLCQLDNKYHIKM